MKSFIKLTVSRSAGECVCEGGWMCVWGHWGFRLDVTWSCGEEHITPCNLANRVQTHMHTHALWEIKSAHMHLPRTVWCTDTSPRTPSRAACVCVCVLRTAQAAKSRCH